MRQEPAGGKKEIVSRGAILSGLPISYVENAGVEGRGEEKEKRLLGGILVVTTDD